MGVTRRRAVIAGVILLAFTAGLMAARPLRFAVRSVQRRFAPEVVVVGRDVPPIPARDARGVTPTDMLAATDGTRILVFWSVSCGYCSNLLATLDEVERESGGELPIMLVTLDQKPAVAGCILSTLGYSWPNFVVYGADADIDRFRREWDLFSVPSTWIVSGEGVITDRLRGFNEQGVRRYFSEFLSASDSDF